MALKIFWKKNRLTAGTNQVNIRIIHFGWNQNTSYSWFPAFRRLQRQNLVWQKLGYVVGSRLARRINRPAMQSRSTDRKSRPLFTMTITAANFRQRENTLEPVLPAERSYGTTRDFPLYNCITIYSFSKIIIFYRCL